MKKYRLIQVGNKYIVEKKVRELFGLISYWRLVEYYYDMESADLTYKKYTDGFKVIKESEWIKS